MIQYHKDKDNIVTLTLDMKNSAVNVINHHTGEAFMPVIEHLEKECKAKQLAGVIITSAKRTFLAGGDLDYLYNSESAEIVFEYTERLNAIFRRLELLSVPIVAAINGAALGSGYELALACHYRIALDTSQTVIGLPEVNLGLIPGSGSIVRLSWTLGIEKAFKLLTSGKKYHVKEALKKGLIDAIATDCKALKAMAKSYILSKPNIIKIWDKESLIPIASNPRFKVTAEVISNLNAKVQKKYKGNHPAIQTILNAQYECMHVNFDKALSIVSRHFTAVTLSATGRNMTKAFWYDYNYIRNGRSRPKGYGKFRARNIGIIGAGDMGAGIALLAAMQGIHVYLKDISISIAKQGKNIVEEQLNQLIERDKLSKAQAQEILALIHPSDQLTDFEACDLVIEAVFENEALKKRILKETELHLNKDAFIASNSSYLSIDKLGQSFSRSKHFLGMHFFVPIQKTDLVEIVVGKNTNEESIARAFDFVQNIGKVPIIVKDSIGFYCMRVLRTYLLESLLLLTEGNQAYYVRNLALIAGMKHGPFIMMDNISLNTFLSLEEDLAHIQKENYDYTQSLEILRAMVNKHKRIGKEGFYNYKEGEQPILWEGLQEFIPQQNICLDEQDIIDRLLFIQILEAYECLEEKVIKHMPEGNLGSIYGWGFPAHKGGVFQFIQDYGIEKFYNRCLDLAAKYGKRFSPPSILEEIYNQHIHHTV